MEAKLTDSRGRPSDELLRAASEWFARLHSGDSTDEDRKRHEMWLTTDADHRDAYMFIVDTCMLAEKAVVGSSRPVSDRPAEIVPLLRAANRNRATKRYLAAGLVAASLLAVVTGAIWWDSIAGTGFETAVGEVRAVTLDDGSTVFLNARSRIAVKYTAAVRGVELIEGEALFTVAKNPARPFRVRAGDRVIQAVGTAFDIDRHAGTVDVEVNEGAVVVTAPGVTALGQSAAGSVDLPALSKGQAVSYIDDRPLSKVRTIIPDQIGAWRSGLLSYEDARFERVIADLNRQFPGEIVIDDRTLASLPVTLTIKLHDRDTTVRTLEKLLPVRALRKDSDVIALVRRNL